MTEKEMIQNIKLPRIPIERVIIDSLTTTRAVGAFLAS